MKRLNTLAISVLSFATLATLAACGIDAKPQKYLLESENITFTKGSADDLHLLEEIKLDTEKAIKDYVKNVYTSNYFGNLGGLVLSNEIDVTGTYQGKKITPKRVNYSHRSDFEKLEENTVDPANSLCCYTREGENVKFYSSKIDPETLTATYEDFTISSSSFSYNNGETKSVKSFLTDSSIKIKNDVMDALFNLKISVDNISVVEMDIATVWNLEK